LNLLVAAAYCVSGRLGLLLAIPPGYASAVWPAAGIALAAVMLGGYRLASGIWLGSFLVNVWTAFDGGTLDALMHSLLVPSAIASGAALQAMLGALLIQTLAGYSNLLAQELAVVRILVLGGPVACVINCTVGVGTLVALGRVPLDSALFNWWTWWVGDSMGVLVFTPLILVWSVRPYHQWIWRQLAATLPLVMLFALVVWLFVNANAREHARVNQQLDAMGERFADHLADDIDQATDMLYDEAAFFGASHEVERGEFSYFASRLLQRMPHVLGLAFDRRITDAQRAAFEAQGQAEGLQGFHLREAQPDGSTVPAPVHDEYVVIDYMEPRSGEAASRGINVAAEPKRRAALLQAANSQRAVASEPLVLVQDPQHAPSLLVFMPVYPGNAVLSDAQQRMQQLMGYAVIILRISDLLATSVKLATDQGADVWVYDDGADAPRRLLYGQGEPPPVGPLYFGRTLHVDCNGRTWRVELRVSAETVLAKPSWQIWTLLAAGMLFTGLVGTFLLVVIGRQSKVEELADRRTAELSRANTDLRREVQRSEKLEVEAQRRARELEASNRELEQFAYVASHDLQAPLRSIASFAQLLQQRYGNKLDADAAEFIGYIRSGVGRMDTMINDILRLSRLAPEKLTLGQVNTQQLVRRACSQLASEIAASGADVRYDNLPEVTADAGMLTQLFQHLLSNAIKFQPKGNKPLITVEAQSHGSEWTFAVRDNGLGIKPQFLSQVFDMFRRLHPQEEYSGSGIGLTVCRKIVQLHRGRIWAESNGTQGTAILFTIPVPVPRGGQ
ncbi:MAG TPA: CHASE domain-containing protein, partial [Nevskiaceae bacterium]|nr:CHASE domain-containing protein [Nevskiaceae bacterium]